MRTADDLVKIRAKIFWGIIWLSGGTEGGLSHRRQSVGLFKLTSLSNSRKRRHQKSAQELHFTL